MPELSPRDYSKKGSLTQKPKGKFLENVKTPGSQSTGPKEMLSDRQLKTLLPKKVSKSIPRTDSIKGRISKVRQVRQSTISSIDGKKMKPAYLRAEFRSVAGLSSGRGGGGGGGSLTSKKTK
jgi:hypothetical protein